MQNEYALQDGDFRKIAKLVMDSTGIVLGEQKRAFVHGRLGRRLRILGLSDFRQYTKLLESDDGDDERRMLINAVTTNHTSFFREDHHFAYLAQTVLPEIVKARGAGPTRLRIWSAGCSTGEEPYTLAMTLLEQQALLAGWDVRILATDLDTNVVRHASEGVYDAERLESIPAAYRRNYLSVSDDGKFRIKDEVRDLIRFAPLNLLEDWPMRGPFDLIFCRNVVIYFDKPTQRTLFDRYADLLRTDGWLFIGHSESLLNVTNRFSLVGRTIYRRTK
uniref:Chemotaxis protein methyltransferase n=1 Tax=Rhodopseudomonas palustris (strain BisA53) TaxID=316055 RepID=Q07SD6_RHOP5